MDVVSVGDLGKVILWVVQILIISKLPVTPTTEKIKSVLQEAVDQIEKQLKSIEESQLKGAVYAFWDGCLALKEALEIGNQPKNQQTDQYSSASPAGFIGRSEEEILTMRAMEQFKIAERLTGDMVYDYKNLTDEHRLIAWNIHLKCVAINSGSPVLAARSWQQRLEHLRESKTDVLAQYMLGQVKKSWYRKDKDLRRACEEWRNEVATTALRCLNTTGEPELALRKIVGQSVQESWEVSGDLLTDWLGIIPHLPHTLLRVEVKCAVLKPGLWIQGSRDAITVYRRDPDSSETTKVKKITMNLRICWWLSVNRISDKLFEVIVSSYRAKMTRVRVEENEDGEITVAEAGSRNAAESQEVIGVYLPSGRILVEIREGLLELIGYSIYDDWDAIPDPIVPSENRVNTTLNWYYGAISYDSMLYFVGKKSGSNSLWLVPETETDRHSDIEIPESKNWYFFRNCYQPSEQLVTVQYESSDKFVTVLFEMPSCTVICRTEVKK